MATNDLVKRIILEHYSNSVHKKLTASYVAEKAGISRTALYKFYGDFVPYIKGEKPIADLIVEDDDDSRKALVAFQETITDLNNRIKDIENQHKKDMERFKQSLLTSFMQNDLSVHDADEVRIQLEKQALQFDHLINKNKGLKTEINLLTTKLNHTSREEAKNLDLILISPNTDAIFSNYQQNSDIDILEDEKEKCIDEALTKVRRLFDDSFSKIIVFIDRYYNQFDLFSSRLGRTSKENMLIVRLPLYSIREIRSFVDKVSSKGKVSLVIPIATSENVVKAQRAFHFKNVPTIELEAADNMAMPSISDGFNEITFIKISQGD